MFYIERKDLENYRFAIAKITFLSIFQEFEVEDYDKSLQKNNCLFVRRGDSETRICISFFGKPTSNINTADYPVIIFPLKKKQGDYLERDYFPHYKERKIRFSQALNENLNDAFLNLNLFLNKYHLSRLGRMDSLFWKMLNVVLFNSYSHDYHNLPESVYHYYGPKAKYNKHKELDGYIFFTDPAKFNDPFDCVSIYNNGTWVNDRIRVFCSTKSPKSIPIWAYYGRDHSGYCFEFEPHDIISSLSISFNNSLCIVGDAIYKKKMPKYYPNTLAFNSHRFSFTILKRIIDCTFTKYKAWEHEDEFRFVVVFDQKQAQKHLPVQVPIRNIYEGCRCMGRPLYDSNHNQLSTKQLRKDPRNYKLV